MIEKWLTFERKRVVLVTGLAMLLGAVALIRWQNTSRREHHAITMTTANAETTRVAGNDHTLEIPLSGGKVDVGRLVGGVSDWLRFDGEVAAERYAGEVDLPTESAVKLMQNLQQATGDVIVVEKSDDAFTLRFDTQQFHREERKVRSGFRTLVEQWFPEEAAAARARYGLWVFTAADQPPVPIAEAQVPQRVIVLIHGLDDPGRVWITLRPQLMDKGYTIVQLEYPNDQSIADSTRLAAAQFALVKQHGAERVDIIAHSMGGLIARDLLTDPQYDRAVFPAVDRLIMVGTPQHGSTMAMMRMAAEWRDQFTRSVDEHVAPPGFLGGIFDGAGEAGIDLLPGSEFLTVLNARPLPAVVKMTIIAGRVTPQLGDAIEGAAETIGDGCVSVESSKLEGVSDYTLVEGNHLSIVRNVTAGSTRTPPAVPIVMDRLAE
jgi:pimeloyl-ACP methyl ester carboxylesterase